MTTVVDRAPRDRCLLRLHGKGEEGAETVVDGSTTVLTPSGNADGWGGRQWVYASPEEFEAARAVAHQAVEGCRRIIVNGFSNGAAFAAKLYCRGETFDGRLLRVVIDDPVVDEAVLECAPEPAVEATLYWTGELDSTAQPGWDCEERDWTCEGGITIGIDAYADALGVDVQPSAFDTHLWFVDAPELSRWE